MIPELPANKRAEIQTAADALDGGYMPYKPFETQWGNEYWIKWATIVEIFGRLGIAPGASVLDVGVGSGWTTAFLAESGYRALGFDIAPAAVASARTRLSDRRLKGRVEVADMDSFEFGEQFDVVLVFDALHHSDDPARVVGNVARHLVPGGWAVFGEPSRLHALSPAARRTARETGWLERGVGVRALKRACARAGLGESRRFFEGTRPYEGRLREYAWQLTRLTAANVAFAPQASIWLAARRR